MSRIWYCPTCGYEVTSRGRCHSCRDRLVASDLPELPAGDGDEVGYRLDDWTDRDRGRLIEVLNDVGVMHRFEDDELVVAAEDESTVDDLVSELTSGAYDDDGEGAPDSDADGSAPGGDGDDPALSSALRLLADAANRLQRDPTDMQADADVAEASTAVFFAESYAGLSDESWAAVGRVTRRLLSVLGSEEALEDGIRSEATVLARLLKPVVAATPADGVAPGLEETDEGEQTVYELPDWLPEQRAQLGILLEQANIEYEWDQDDLVVPAANEGEVERLFAEVGGANDDDDDADEERYHALEVLFAASGRLASDPTDEERAAAVVMWVHEVLGPPPLGMDEVYWLRITSRARALAEALEGDLDDAEVIHDEASALHGLLRTVV